MFSFIYLFFFFYSFPVLLFIFLLPYCIPVHVLIDFILFLFLFVFTSFIPLHVLNYYLYSSSCSYLFLVLIVIFLLMSFIIPSHPSKCLYSCVVPLLLLPMSFIPHHLLIHVSFYFWCSNVFRVLIFIFLSIYWLFSAFSNRSLSTKQS